jgi:Fur family ferric uptake transcriptional regulator
MTLAHHAPALQAPDLASALQALRERGMRVSASRRQVLEALYAHTRPLSAEELARDGDLASVYRNLDVLEEIGLVRHVHLGHGPGLYSLAARDNVEFVVCERCDAHNAVEPHRLDSVRALIERELGYRARFTHFPIVGLCAACLREDDGHAHP